MLWFHAFLICSWSQPGLHLGHPETRCLKNSEPISKIERLRWQAYSYVLLKIFIPQGVDRRYKNQIDSAYLRRRWLPLLNLPKDCLNFVAPTLETCNASLPGFVLPWLYSPWNRRWTLHLLSVSFIIFLRVTLLSVSISVLEWQRKWSTVPLNWISSERQISGHQVDTLNHKLLKA